MRYTVKDTHIRHGDVIYGPGDAIELADDEAAPLAHHLESVDIKEELPIDPDGVDEADDNKKRRRR